MSEVAAGRRVAALMAATALFLCHSPAMGQDAEVLDPALQAPLDPSAPLDPLPGLGVEWPDLESGADDGIPDIPDTAVADAAVERTYTVAIRGLDGIDAGGIRAQFAELSVLEANRGDPANAAQIDRRADEDRDLLIQLLRARGYYDAVVEARAESGAGTGQVNVILEAQPGALYRFAEVSLPGIEAAGADESSLRTAFGIRQNDPVDAAAVTAGTAALRVALGEQGYAFATVGELDIVVDHEARSATLRLPVAPGGDRRFGAIVVDGTPLFSPEHIGVIARFDEGDPFEQSRLEDLRRALVATGLVSTVMVRPVANEATGRVDVAVALEPAPPRTVAGEIGYGTGEGLRVEGSWQHRNLLPPEGAVTFRGVLGTREQVISATLRRNNFRRRDQVLNALVAATHVEREAYEAHTFTLSGNIERQSNIIWQKAWTWFAGAELLASDERDVDLASEQERSRTFFIGALPAGLAYDGSDDLLDPTRGFRLSGRLSPEISLQDGAFGYARAQIDASFYRPVNDRVVFAGRVRLGTILGAERDRIAPSRRFYAGGGGSVRGYGYQALGPRDPVFRDPIGGRSLAEFSIEARVRTPLFENSLSIVPFLDAGNIYTGELPDTPNLRFGAGVGVRYHTNFGPIRVDVGTPLNPQSGDSRVAVYVSLGQAF
ncbi:BamA/TamA family outer membrane protein [Allosphingosinicella flava]|uniref:BamA/TamA family outer membrane protein n=1 Tax=Allosphingosinicella flava TaxID=2771430 RepID=A0A7T2GHW4_9SPHN|nr:BamA/TamA family outer membrane protein [Sphingosinicella flava]QPQ54002.1 BamA/TamA family outer membrane protein [Sphingosinicella flava]